MEFFAVGSKDSVIDEAAARELLRVYLNSLAQRQPLRKVLLLPPDITRWHSWAGFLTCELVQMLPSSEVYILPALGTHRPMTPVEISRMFPGINPERFRVHDWRNGVDIIGEVPSTYIHEVSEGKLNYRIQVEVDQLLLRESWDAIISIGQLVPHEVIGIANQNKNVLIGAGGSDMINKSHFLGAVYGMERLMGKAKSPVRDVLNYASEHFLKSLPLSYLLTVRARDGKGELVTRGMFAGDDHASYLRGAELCRQVNLDRLSHAPQKMVVYLDPLEFKSTWLGNKAIYRTRMAIADHGELIILAPGVKEFGEDATIDRLIRKFGYRGTAKTLQAVHDDSELGQNLSAAAHLIHGSSEGRFCIRYAPGHLSREEIENIGYEYGDLQALMQQYPVERLQDGWNRGADGQDFFYISNPALGLWGTAERFD